jgi:hypothetical protein
MTDTPNAPAWPRHPAHKADEPQCIHHGGECGESGYRAPCPNRPQLDYDPDDVAFTSDPINPNHYRAGKVECIDALAAATVNKCGIEAVCTANAIKYLWRYESKGGLEDVRKARWYLDHLAQHLGE